jgi:hypothetical protein
MSRSKIKTAAKLAGVKRYFTGNPCPAGHICERRVCNGACIDCHRVTTRKSSQAYRKHHPEKIKNWRKENKNLINALTAKRRASQKHATPKWVNLEDIKTIYQSCPEGYVVDHIVPLTNKAVCGLHVPWNLQYLTPSENSSKGNKFAF